MTRTFVPGPRYRTVGDFAAECFGNALGARERRLRQQDEELLAGVATLEIGAAQHFAHPLADDRQHRVAAQVTVAIVDVLQAIHVEHDERHRGLAAARAAQFGVDHLDGMAAREATGEGVADAVLPDLAGQLGVSDRQAPAAAPRLRLRGGDPR